MLHHFNIARWHVQLDFPNEDNRVGIHLVPSLEPFRVTDADTADFLLSLIVSDDLNRIPETECQRIRTFDTGNGNTIVDRLSDGGYQFVISDVYGNDCALLICSQYFDECRCVLYGNEPMRCFGLNNALMLAYAFAGAAHDTLLIHASLVRHDGYGYAFTAQSGMGKSTQVANWLRTIPNCDLMNDDNPIIRILPDVSRPVVFGSPWSGKTPCYRPVEAPLGAITKIVRAPENHVERLSIVEALTVVLPACSSMKWDERIYNAYFATLTKLLSMVQVYNLHCTAAAESAAVCCQSIKVSP